MQDHHLIDYAIEITTPITCNGYRLQGAVKVTNTSTTRTLVFDEPGTLGINIGWRLLTGGTTLAEGRLDPNGSIAVGKAREFQLVGDLSYSYEGRRQIVIDLVIDTVAWLGLETPHRTAQALIDIPPTEMFDPIWYRETYDLPDDMSDNDAESHFEKYGQRFGNAPNPYLSPTFMLQQVESLDLPRDLQPGELLASYGQLIEPHPLLRRVALTYGTAVPPVDLPETEYGNNSWYILRHLDAPGVRVSPFLDPGFVQTEDGGAPNKPINYALSHLYYTDAQLSSLFDPEFYLATNPDVRAMVNEKRRFRSALQHFLEFGIRENRAPIPDFDVDYYRHHNPDVRALEEQGGPSLTEHFFTWGIVEGRNPNGFFDTGYYLANQPDVHEACKRLGLAGPFEHFLKIGYKAGYKASRPLICRDVPDAMGKALYEKRCNVTATALMRDRRKIAFPDLGNKAPDLSCIIPVCNQFEMTAHLLSLLSDFAWRADTPSAEVIVVDNGSTDLTANLADITENVKIVRVADAIGYTKACNLGATYALGSVLLFMNNDMEINSSSLTRGVERLMSDPSIGALGGRIIQMNGTIQEAGSEIFNQGSTLGVGRNDDPNAIRYSAERAVRYVSGCLMFLRREAFMDLDGFDEVFSPGYYEETDLCFRLEQSGFTNIYDPAIFAYHYEYASYSRGRPPQISIALMERNRARFREKHASALNEMPAPSVLVSPTLARARLQTGPLSIAIVEDLIPDPRLGSGFVRSMDIVDTLLEQGHRVTLLIRNFAPSTIQAQLKTRGVEIVSLYVPGAPENPLNGREFDFDVLWVCRTHNFKIWGGYHAAAKRTNPNLRLVFDTEALGTLRDIEYRRLNRLPAPADISLALHEELGLHCKPDCIIAVNEVDKSWTEKYTDTPVEVLGHAVDLDMSPRPLTDRDGIYFCGSFHTDDSPNYDSVEWFLSEVWPGLYARLPDIEFRISGYVPGNVDLNALIRDAPNVRFLGTVPDVRTELNKSRLFVAPTRFAGGIPHKVHQSMASGVPTVCSELLARQLATTDIPPESLPLYGVSTSQPEAWIDACVKILTDDKEWNTLHAGSLEFIETHASRAEFHRAIESVLQSVY